MSTPFSTPDAIKSLAMDVRGVAPKDIVSQALILQCSTLAGEVEGDAPSVLVPYVSFEDQPGFIAEGSQIPESEPDDTQVQIFTGKVAILVPVSREQMGQPDAAALLSDAAREAVIRKANRAFLAQEAPVAPAATPPKGILTGVTPEADDIETAGSLDPVVDAIAKVEADGGQATSILVHPNGWAQLQKLKLGTDSNASLLGPGSAVAPANAPARALLNVPVLVDKDVPEDNLVVLDRRGIVSVSGQVLLAQSADWLFGYDSIALRITWRFGAKVAKPNRLVVVPLTP
jgi:HK97 family phage major capsid protein